jgi:hypothetical protein
MLNVQHISLEHCSFESYTHWDSAVVLDAHDVMRCFSSQHFYMALIKNMAELKNAFRDEIDIL